MTIDGDGFIPTDTLVYIAGANYTHLGSTSYSRIELTTPRELTYTDLDLNVYVYVRTSQAECLRSSCCFNWARRVTPYFRSVQPTHIRGRTNLTITGENLISGGQTTVNASVDINGNDCRVTQITNNSIACQVDGVEAGIHTIEGSIDGLFFFFFYLLSFENICFDIEIGNIYSSVNITSDPIITTIEPFTSSIYGGETLTIDGHGFSSDISDIQVTIDTHPCPVIEASESEIECRIPPQGISPNISNINITSQQIIFPTTSTLNYSSAITPMIASISPTVGSNAQVLVLTGSHFTGPGQTYVFVGETQCNISSLSTGSITCTIGSTLSAGNHTVRVFVEEVGNSNENLIYTHDISISSITPSEGGYGGGLTSIITGNGFNGTDVSVNVCNRPCLSVDVISNDRIDVVTPSFPITSGDVVCNMTVDVDGFQENRTFTYKANLTRMITSISPNRGGTGGGTTVTITGNDFP